jgi:hypothetical protein
MGTFLTHSTRTEKLILLKTKASLLFSEVLTVDGLPLINNLQQMHEM